MTPFDPIALNFCPEIGLLLHSTQLRENDSVIVRRTEETGRKAMRVNQNGRPHTSRLSSKIYLIKLVQGYLKMINGVSWLNMDQAFPSEWQ